MLPRWTRRHRSQTFQREEGTGDDDDEESQLVREVARDSRRSERARLVMAQNHMLAFVITMYLLYGICRLLGWKPGIRSPTYTLTFGNLT